MQTQELFAHPAHPPMMVKEVTARLDARDADWVRLRWRIEAASGIRVPPFTGRKRLDGLWQTTCFELFVVPECEQSRSYTEFNFSPSEAWAAYDFSSYREGRTNRPLLRKPVITWRGGSRLALMDVALSRDALPRYACRIGLTAVIEEGGGQKSFWAARHSADAPDFHDPACFASTLAAPEDV